MATTLVPSTVTITHTIQHTLPDGTSRSWSSVHTIADVKYCDRRTMAIPTTEISILKAVAAGLAIGAGTFTDAKVAYLMIRPMDNANFITVGLKDTAGDTVYHKVSTGMLIVFPSLAYDANILGLAFGAFVFPDDIVAFADTAAVDIEIFIVQTT